MSLLVDPGKPELLTVGDRKYHLRPPSVIERSRWRRATAAAGGRQHGAFGLLNGLAKGVRVLMVDSPPEARDGVLSLIEAQRDRVRAYFDAAKKVPLFLGGEMSEADKVAHQEFADATRAMDQGDASLTSIVAEVTSGYPAYGQMVADEAMYWQITGIEGARLLLVDWEGFGDAKVTRGPAGVTDECLAEIPEDHFTAIGQAINSLASVTPQQRKNLLSPRPSSSAGETSSI